MEANASLVLFFDMMETSQICCLLRAVRSPVSYLFPRFHLRSLGSVRFATMASTAFPMRGSRQLSNGSRTLLGVATSMPSQSIKLLAPCSSLHDFRAHVAWNRVTQRSASSMLGRKITFLTGGSLFREVRRSIILRGNGEPKPTQPSSTTKTSWPSAFYAELLGCCITVLLFIPLAIFLPASAKAEKAMKQHFETAESPFYTLCTDVERVYGFHLACGWTDADVDALGDAHRGCSEEWCAMQAYLDKWRGGGSLW